MTISSSLNAGISGLQSNATRLGSISDNIANSSTFGYKRVITDFNSLVLANSGASYTAGGVRASTQRLVGESGSLVNTSNATDLAVTGRGMLPVTSKASVLGDNTPEMMLATTGSFRIDEDGYLANETDLVLMGWPANNDGSIPAFSRDTSDGLEPIRFSLNLSGDPTTQISMGLNLPATSTVAGSAGETQNLSVEYFDNLGISRSIALEFTPTVPATGSSNEWTVTLRDSAQANALIGEYVVTFNDTRTGGGTIASVTTVLGGAHDPVTGEVVVDVAGGPISFNIGALGDNEGLVQLSDTFAPIAIDKDGSPVGNMVSVEVDANGFVKAIFDTGVNSVLYQIPLVDIPNPGGLIALDSQTYKPSNESGPYFLWDAGQGPTGDLKSFAREESTVDVATELTAMIRTQRAYSSNAKVIQTVELSLAVATDLPVEISPWVLARLLLMDFRVCSATIALLFVLMLDMNVFLMS
ncbi:flagellar hook-basal body complex protein [Photobacterium sp. TY 1-4]|uniref:Flagellar hook protein FlgE n=1 Tax=Pseudosulfitobacter koreensis TaxID=2968472 RepID=A0ABT1YWT7_9RHOB|nr:flagellar hook-basal body complex protein [Pseudosulfitobacter koreense]